MVIMKGRNSETTASSGIAYKNSATAEGPRDALCLWMRAMFQEAWEIETFQTANVIFKVIGNGATAIR